LAASDLLTLWRRSAERLERRLAGLDDAEFFWAPVPDAWTVFEGPHGWTYHYEFAPPPPVPVTTIAWRLHHIVANNWIYWEFAFGEGKRTFPDLTVNHTATDAIVDWQASAAPIVAWLEDASEEALDEMRPNHQGHDLSARTVVTILLDEQIHHGAEIALLRDLYARREHSGPIRED
jgi:hypothetical protein